MSSDKNRARVMRQLHENMAELKTKVVNSLELPGIGAVSVVHGDIFE